MQYMKELCKDLQIQELEPSAEGVFTFSIPPSLKIEISPLDPGLFFYSPLALCPKEKKEELLILLMKANLFGQGTMGAVIGFRPEENLLTLSSHLPYDMNYRAFKESLEDFSNVVEYWRGEIDRHIKQAREGIL